MATVSLDVNGLWCAMCLRKEVSSNTETDRANDLSTFTFMEAGWECNQMT